MRPLERICATQPKRSTAAPAGGGRTGRHSAPICASRPSSEEKMSETVPKSRCSRQRCCCSPPSCGRDSSTTGRA
eukprot:7385448-Prymnesium_polylepis.1